MKVGIFNPNFPVDSLKFENDENGINRDLITSNIEDKKDKLESNGWLMPIVILENGLVLEGNHRAEAAVSLNQKTVPVYIVDWVEPSDIDDKREAIISLNSGNKAWVQWDYIKSYRASLPAYKKAYEACLKYNNLLSNGLVVVAMFGLGAMNERFKTGKSELKDKDIYEYILSTMASLVKRYGKSEFPSQTLRGFAKFVHANSKDMGLANYVVNQMKNEVKQGRRVADGDMGLKQWLELQKTTYASIKSGKQPM